MAQNPIRTAAAAESGLVTGTLLEAVVKRFGYVLNTGESLADLDFDVGNPPLIVVNADNGFTYFYDATDTTTVDDGSTCLVSGNGQRYKASSGARPFLSSVLTIATAPPGSPTVGDAHIVGVGTGDFAGHDDAIAFYTRRGWRFADPIVGLTMLVESTGTNWQFTASGWGGFPVELDDGSVRPEALLQSMGLPVESTEDTPPGSPTVDTYWLVGTSPTGDFVGHASDIAYHDGADWQFLSKYAGATIFHKTLGFLLHYVSGSWLGGAGSDMQEFSTAGADTWTKPAKGTMAFIQCWGAGGSGGRGGSGDSGGGGGGGGYNERWVKLSDLSATESVTVGAGGPARTSDGDGAVGGDTSFGSLLTAYGGGAGVGTGTDFCGGGGGAGLTAAGSVGTAAVGGAGGAGVLDAGGAGGSSAAGTNGGTYSGGGGGAGRSGSLGYQGGDAFWGGGGGSGGGQTAGAAGNRGGNSYHGGGGGGGSQTNASTTPGGTSVRGGDGGAGRGSSTNADAGSQPGGGGGGSTTGNSGKGGDGLVRVTVI